MISIRNLRFVSAQPAITYYAWQVEVMLNNFKAMGINLNQVDIVCWKQNGVVPDEWSKLATAYPARFFFYDDTRETKHYISSIRPNILKQHWEKYPELSLDAIFYHDCDIVFTKPPTEWITDIMIKDKRWYGSDTRWYIGHDYIRSKGEDILEAMCDIVGISKFEVERNELASIGAQYLMKNIDYSFWDKVEKDSERLFKEITDLNNIKKQIDPSYHELQIWCADMWAVLWNGWLRENHTLCHENFNFSWGTSTEEEYHKLNIMHNAGVTSPHEGLFYKAQYMSELPYGKDLSIREGTASKKYWEWVELAAKQSNLI
jgi:hypothetical protein